MGFDAEVRAAREQLGLAERALVDAMRALGGGGLRAEKTTPGELLEQALEQVKASRAKLADIQERMERAVEPC